MFLLSNPENMILTGKGDIGPLWRGLVTVLSRVGWRLIFTQSSDNGICIAGIWYTHESRFKIKHWKVSQIIYWLSYRALTVFYHTLKPNCCLLQSVSVTQNCYDVAGGLFVHAESYVFKFPTRLTDFNLKQGRPIKHATFSITGIET